MPRKPVQINAVIHVSDESQVKRLKYETEKMYISAIKKYLEKFSPEDKKEIINGLISEFGQK